MAIVWHEGRSLDATCPVCGHQGPKRARLTADPTIEGSPAVTLLDCPGCGSAFYDNLVAPDYEDEAGYDGAKIKFYMEQGAAIDMMIEPLLRFDPRRVKRFLEIGCGFGFSLDFAQRALGWTAKGMDPAPIAEAGRDTLDLDIESAYFTDDTALPEPYDIVMCSEVIEHIPEPHGFLRTISRALSPTGSMVLSTPNVTAVDPGTAPGSLQLILSPNFHLILFSRAALEHVLRQAGFQHVEVWELAHSLYAVASRAPIPPPESKAATRAAYRRYLGERGGRAKPGSPLSTGLAYRLFKDMVNAGDYDTAGAAFESLRVSMRARYGFDIAAPRSLPLDQLDGLDLEDFTARSPFNLCGALYFRGILALNGAQDHALAIDCFRTAAKAGLATRKALQTKSLDDGETEDLTWRARMLAVEALSAINPAAAITELGRLTGQRLPGDPPDVLWRIPAGLAGEAADRIFMRFVNTGQFPLALQLEPAARTRHGFDGEDQAAALRAAPAELAPQVLYGIAMIELAHHGRHAEAARLFGIVFAGLRDRAAAAPLSPALAELMWTARFHQGLALRFADDLVQAGEIAGHIAAGGEAGLPPVPPGLIGRLAEIRP